MTLNRILLFSICILFTSCTEHYQPRAENKSGQLTDTLIGDTVPEIGLDIRCIFQDSENNRWFTTNGKGVYKYDTRKTIIHYTDKHGLPSNYVWNVQERTDGKIWFKTNLRPDDVERICYFDHNTFTTMSVENPSPLINSNPPGCDLLFYDYYYNGKSLAKITLPHTSPLKNQTNLRHHYDVYCACIDRNGAQWFGTCTAGVCKYDGKNYTWINNKKLGAPVRCIFEDKQGTIWIGTNGNGLFKYDPTTGMLTNFSEERKIANPDPEKYPTGKEGTLSRIWTITDDKQGNLWIGTIDNGVWMYDGKAVTNYTTSNGLGSDFIWTIYKDKNNTLWFGTDGAGVYIFNGNRFEKFKP